MLGTMLLVGPRLYGDQVARDPVEGLRWLRAAASAGNEIAQFQVARLAKGH
jgi:TPR repeat protein